MKRRDREDKIEKGWGKKGWNVETKTSWRLFWRGVGTRFTKKRKLKEEVNEGKGDREETGGGGEAADAAPAAGGPQAVRVDAAEVGT